MTASAMVETPLPALPLEDWQATKDTLHLWAQIVGKTRLALMPMRNHWWNVTLYPSARGFTTRRMPVEAHNLEIEINLVDHRLTARTTEAEAGFALHDGLSVAQFHRRLMETLDELEVSVDIRAEPFGVPTTTPFELDEAHAAYDADAPPDISGCCSGAPTCSRSSPVGTAGRRAPSTSSGTASTLRPAGSRASGSRVAPGLGPRRSRGVLPRGHQLRFLGRRCQQPVPRLLLVHGARAGRSHRTGIAPRDRRVGRATDRRLPRDPAVRRREELAATRGPRSSTSSRAPTKPVPR